MSALPADLVWENGHATELALTAFADGQESILPRALCDHVQACDACMSRLGEVALLSAHVDEAIVSAKPARQSSSALATARAFPMKPIAAALGVAALASAPSILAFPQRLASIALALQHSLPVLSRGTATAMRTMGPAFMGTMLGAALLLVMGCIALVRTLPQPVSGGR